MTPLLLLAPAAGGGQVEQIARAFGVDNLPTALSFVSLGPARVVRRAAEPSPRVRRELYYVIRSGATARSKDCRNTIVSCDIGGGTSNIAVSKNGKVISTSCVAVGGRLHGVNSRGKIWRMSRPAANVMADMGLDYGIGDSIPEADVEKIAARFAEVLFEVITGPAKTSLADS